MKATRLSKEELQEIYPIMVKGNTLLKQCAEMMGLTHREFRGLLFNNKLDISKLAPEQLEILNAAKPFIFAVRDKCEMRVRAGFRRMLKKQSFLAARNNLDPYHAEQNFSQEGEIAILDAVYSYTDTNIKLSSYVWRVMRRRIVDAINQSNQFCPLTNEAIKILQRVEEAREKFHEPVSDEIIIESIGLTPKEREVFFGATIRVKNEEFERGGSEGFNVTNHMDDYTSNRRGINSEVKETFFIRKEVRQAVKDAQLDSFELECLFAEMFPYIGWKEDVSSKHGNPHTGKRYTRQNVEHVLARAKKKVRDMYTHPPKVHVDNPMVDKLFDEWDAEQAISQDQA